MKVALIGCGVIAASHVRILRRLLSSVEIAVCDQDAARLAAFASKHSIGTTFASMSDVLETFKPESVHIVTPPATHGPLAEQALEKGVNVYVEKPVAETREAFLSLADLAHRKHCCLYSGYSTLGMPVVQRALHAIRSNEFGRLISVHCDFAGSDGGGVIPYGNCNHWAYALKGGVLQNMIDHPLSLVAAVLDEISSVQTSVIRRNLLPKDNADLMHVVIEGGDAVGSFTLSLGHGCNDRRARFLLERGTITIDMGRQLFSSVRGSGPQNFIKKAQSGISEGAAFALGTIGNIVNAASGKLQRDPGITGIVGNYYEVLQGKALPLVDEAVVGRITGALDRIWEHPSNSHKNAQPLVL